jgi:hypothetical protein
MLNAPLLGSVLLEPRPVHRQGGCIFSVACGLLNTFTGNLHTWELDPLLVNEVLVTEDFFNLMFLLRTETTYRLAKTSRRKGNARKSRHMSYAGIDNATSEFGAMNSSPNNRQTMFLIRGSKRSRSTTEINHWRIFSVIHNFILHFRIVKCNIICHSCSRFSKWPFFNRSFSYNSLCILFIHFILHDYVFPRIFPELITCINYAIPCYGASYVNSLPGLTPNSL